MSYQDIINNVSKDLGLSYEVVDRVYKAYWFFIKKHIKSLPLTDGISEEDFETLRTNFNIPSLGKLFVMKDNFLKYRKKVNNIKSKNKQ